MSTLCTDLEFLLQVTNTPKYFPLLLRMKAARKKSFTTSQLTRSPEEKKSTSEYIFGGGIFINDLFLLQIHVRAAVASSGEN